MYVFGYNICKGWINTSISPNVMSMLERKVLYSKHIMVYIHCGVALTSRVLKAIMKGNEGMSSSLGVVIISIHTVNTPSSSLTS